MVAKKKNERPVFSLVLTSDNTGWSDTRKNFYLCAWDFEEFLQKQFGLNTSNLSKIYLKLFHKPGRNRTHCKFTRYCWPWSYPWSYNVDTVYAGWKCWGSFSYVSIPDKFDNVDLYMLIEYEEK